MTSYGERFDTLAHRWAIIENEHDKQHPDRSLCGGVGACSMMYAAHVLSEDMIEALDEWRGSIPFATGTLTWSPPAMADKSAELAAVKSSVLYALLVNLDGWIGTTRENHEAMGHRHESRGEECWRRFEPPDIRRMINDVAREVGVTEFPTPLKPRENA
jgi:hypothetical protein